MSRFGNLEFGDESARESQSQRSERTGDDLLQLEAADAAFAEGDFEKALRRYSKVLEFNPNLAAAWTGQVRMLIELGEFKEAKLWADKALERFPHEPELLAAKAVALARNGDLQGALVFSDASIGEQGDSPYLWLARGDVLLTRKETRADYCFEKASELSPRDWFTAWLAARVRMFHEQFVLALKLLEQAIEWKTGQFVLWLELGRCQQALGLMRPARQSFAQARQLDPRSAAAGAALLELERNDTLPGRARGWWRRFLKR
jgi:tetratricopeptide (TPR) repeat protein